jgi:guanosine-3',5'-bis(diphosphate) 3'-pyrophosphohydrolase
VDLMERAYVYSARVHEGQMRLSGEPYLSHPLEVAGILADMRWIRKVLPPACCTTWSKTPRPPRKRWRKSSAKEVRHIVSGVTKLSTLPFQQQAGPPGGKHPQDAAGHGRRHPCHPHQAADRLHNMRTLQFHKEKRKRAIAQETIDIYAPIARGWGSTGSRTSWRTSFRLHHAGCIRRSIHAGSARTRRTGKNT